MRCVFLNPTLIYLMMSLYWNNKLLKKIFDNQNKRKLKYKITTEVGRFYFYFEKDASIKENNISGKLLFFPKKNYNFKDLFLFIKRT